MKLEEMQLRALEKRMTVSANKAAQDPKATKEKRGRKTNHTKEALLSNRCIEIGFLR